MARIAAGELDKVVLAHDLLAVAEDDIDVRAVLAGLAAGNPDCWTFAVGGLVGATPELLVRRTGDRVVSRVLAGTTARGGDPADDQSRVDALLHSAKDQRGAPATRSSRWSRRWCRTCATSTCPTIPHVLELSNVTHLATDVTATVAGRLGRARPARRPAPDGGRRWHPAAGRPRRCWPSLEAMNRGRYTGPVGWVDARGDGEWCIALRCAQLDGRTARLFAGCGIVAGSDPDDEVLEAQAKLVPVRDALEGVTRR